MTQALPYLLIDDDFHLNYSLVVLILHKLGLSSKKSAVLDFEKLQLFLYLIKNPSKINPVLCIAGKKFATINSQYTYTIESLSTNVDILFNRSKLKHLLRELAARGMLACKKDSEQSPIKYLLNERGEEFASHLINQSTAGPTEDSKSVIFSASGPSYFSAAIEAIDSLTALQSQPTSKLSSYLNTIFKGN